MSWWRVIELRALGLTPHALRAWAGTDRISALPARLPALAAPSPMPAAAALVLFVAGGRLPIDRARHLPVDALLAAGLLERDGDEVHAPRAIVPLRESVIVCDHHDATDREDLVAWPDDSSYHLMQALPAERRARWLDLGCGSAFAQLGRPGLADVLAGTDANPRAIDCARLGAELSRITRLSLAAGDIRAPHEPADLVTCNAPLPDVTDRAIWRRAGDGFFAALWPAIRAALAPGGLAVVHTHRSGIPAELAGERVIVAYAPDMAVLWWRPDEPARLVTAERALTVDRPHVDARDRDDALAAC